MRERFEQFTHTLTKGLETWQDLKSPHDMKECVPICWEGDLVGMAYYKDAWIQGDFKAEIGIVIYKDHWNKGLGKWGIKSICQRAKMHGVKEIYSKVFRYNEPMIHLMEKLDWDLIEGENMHPNYNVYKKKL